MGYFDDALSVVLADDHHFFREGLRGLLEEDGVRVVGEAANGAQALALVRECAPDVAIVDLRMPDCPGLETLRRITACDARVRTIVLTASAEEKDLREALAAGACGYLLKDTRSDLLVGAIRQAADGHMVLAREVGGKLMSHVHTTAHDGRDVHTLTARETEVLRLIADGADNVSIGRELSISPNTVKQYVTNIFEKLGVRSRVQAAVHAVRVGLV